MKILPESQEENLARLHAAVEGAAAKAAGLPVFLVDGDRTLTAEDTSRSFFSRAGMDPLLIKRRFQRDGYTFDAFRYHAELHLALGEEIFRELAPEIAAEVVPYPGILPFLRAAVRRGQVFVVSAGIPRIWRSFLDRNDLLEVGVIGGIDPAEPYVFGHDEKGVVAEIFRRYASVTVAVGDSEVDAAMLNGADHAIVVVNHNQNRGLLPLLKGHPSLFQVVPQGQAHPHLPILSFPDIVELGSPRRIS
jgi:phosphoserine phosphatase